MNGLRAEPPPKTMSIPSNKRIMITGASQNFRRSFMKNHKSLINSIVLLFCLVLPPAGYISFS